ncbi:MAG TPA: zinc-binding dehydrogenase [Anaerovoracaceae bacterium]|nr:zinc-binding dehydrogenase [Anaerovoracaceae bacterium]
MKGRVVSMTGIEQVQIKEFDLPEPEKGEILMEVIKSNICGSDVHMWEGKHIFKNHVLGHEMVGRVYKLGEGVTTDYAGEKVKEGDRICPVYYLTCLKCKACLEGNFNVCTHGSDFQGQLADKYPHFTGSFATHYVIHPNQYFYKVPENIPDNVVAGANCGIAQMLYALESINIRINDYIVVQGMGGLGLFTAAICDIKGANVIAIDSVDDRLREAKAFGAKHVIDMKKFVTKEARYDEILKITGEKGPDIVVDVSGFPAAFDEAVRMCKIGGTVLEIGNVSVDESMNTTVVPGQIVRKCLTVKGILRYPPIYLYKTLKFLENYHDKYPFNSLTDQCYSLDEAQTALQKSARKEVKRAIIEPNKK